MMFRAIFLVVYLSMVQLPLFSRSCENKIIYLFSAPRSLSTAFLRMMESREDFTIYNEPTIPLYYKDFEEEEFIDYFIEGGPVSFEEVKTNIYSSLKKQNVFIKDMSYSSYHYSFVDKDFISDPSVFFVVLVRNPHHSLLSCYKKESFLYPEINEVLGLKRVYEEYELLKKANPNGVKIVFSEQLYKNPRDVMTAYCDCLDIPFTEKAFHWNKLTSNDQVNEIWNQYKKKEVTFNWYDNALNSTGIGKPHEYQTDQDGNPTFEEISDLEDRNAMIKVYEESMIYYKKFLYESHDFLLRRL